uniref:Uncharacterized protein n=1 Tax=Trichobilharzia regenti TaxID=157069 RepID=A0AA85J2Q8_TRIRE|nr:unnamed protein product [Trichobilharzia regenti]
MESSDFFICSELWSNFRKTLNLEHLNKVVTFAGLGCSTFKWSTCYREILNKHTKKRERYQAKSERIKTKNKPKRITMVVYHKPPPRQTTRSQQLIERMRKSIGPRYYPGSEDPSHSDESFTLDDSSDDEDISEKSTDIIDRVIEFPLDPMPMGIRKKQAENAESKKILGFGMKSSRFPKPSSHLTITPAPGTYEKYQEYNVKPKLSKCQQSFTKAPNVNRHFHADTIYVGPGVYNYAKFHERSTVVESKGRFDTSNESRCKPIKVGYMARLVPTQNGPRLTNAKSSIDELLSPKYANKGKFSETERKTLQLTNQSGVSPNQYNPVDPNMYQSSFNVKSVPFLKQAPRMTKREFNNYIQNVTPFTGPGRYNLPKYDTSEEKEPECHFYLSKCPRSLTLLEEKKFQGRLQPTNIPTPNSCTPFMTTRSHDRLVGNYLKIQ